MIFPPRRAMPDSQGSFALSFRDNVTGEMAAGPLMPDVSTRRRKAGLQKAQDHGWRVNWRAGFP